MKRTMAILFFVVCAMMESDLGRCEEPAGDAARKAREIHDLATSDVIYVQDELKALYYQNLQIIELLKQIRDVLTTKLENSKS